MTRLVNGGVEFRFYRPRALNVSLAGSFNRWDTTAQPMRKLENGWWGIMLHLPPGEYQFRYIADEEWYTDYASFGIERSRDEWNSVLFVPQMMESQAMRRAA
jgi:1,4-alpha-glucan branching enzyme